VEGLAASTNLDHDLPQAGGSDCPGDPTHLSDHLVVGHCGTSGEDLALNDQC